MTRPWRTFPRGSYSENYDPRSSRKSPYRSRRDKVYQRRSNNTFIPYGSRSENQRHHGPSTFSTPLNDGVRRSDLHIPPWSTNESRHSQYHTNNRKTFNARRSSERSNESSARPRKTQTPELLPQTPVSHVSPNEPKNVKNLSETRQNSSSEDSKANHSEPKIDKEKCIAVLVKKLYNRPEFLLFAPNIFSNANVKDNGNGLNAISYITEKVKAFNEKSKTH